MDLRIIKTKAIKPLLLKDYLLDDFSSCSSNGFKSFPRRQCCTTVRFLIDSDLKNKRSKYPNFKKNPPPHLKNPSKSASSTALNSAFKRVITAVKHLPFAAAANSPAAAQKKVRKSILPMSLSKRILKKSFWKRSSGHKEIERLKSIDHLVKEKSEPFSSTSESNDGNRKTNSWSDNDFTASDDSLPFLTELRNDAGVGKKVVAVANDVVSTDTTASSEASACTNSTQTKEKEWRNEKEQFSPVSVLDCPFKDDDEVSSPFQHRDTLLKGTKSKLMKKLERFECLAQLEPVNLAKRFIGQESDNNESVESSLQYFEEKFISDIEEKEEEEEDRAEQKALELLHLMKSTMPSLCLKLNAENLLLDYFRENIINRYLYSEEKWVEDSFYDKLFKDAKDWINGQPQELFLEWGLKKNRHPYVKDMEKGTEWTTLHEQIKEVALDLEGEVYDSLMIELLLDLKNVLSLVP